MKKSSHYLSDPKLTFRIREYLEAGNKKYVGVDSVVEHLQSVFSEYGRKKKTAFRKSVEKAYRIVCQELAIPDTAKTNSRDTGQETTFKKRKTNQDDGESSDSLSFSDDNEAYMDYKDANAVNNLMSDMYKKSNKRGAHSAPVSAASSPKRPDTANQAPDLCKTLFVIDRSGNNKKEQIANSNLSLTESLTSSTPKGFRKNSSDVSESIGGKNRTLYSVDEDEMVDSTSMISPVDVDKSMRGKQQLKTTKDDDLSIKSSSAAPSAKKKKKTGDKETKKKGPEVQVSSVTFADVGGNETALKEVCKLLVHMKHPEVYRQLGVTPPRGFLLHGPPGCGKTLLANAIAGELQLPYIKLAATEVVSGVSGESEEKLRDIFDKAVQSAPCILFIDEIDSITQKRENASKDMERRIVAQLLSCMDDLNSKPDIQVLVIGATNRADSLDPALRRAGRFDREICMGIPGETARLRILEVLCRGLRLNETFDYHHLAKQTPGFVGADLMALAREAAIIAVNRVFNRLQSKNTCLLEHSTNKNNEKVKESELSTPCVHSSTDSTNVPHELVLNKLNSDVHNRNIDDTSKHKHLDDSVNHTQIAMDSSVELKPVFEANNCMEVDDSQPNLQKETQGESSSTRRDIVHSGGSGTSEKQTANLDADFKLVLNWLKDEPPLSEEELRTLYITMLDFEEALKHVQPSAKREGFATIPDVTWDDIGALKDVREELEMAILAPVRHPEQFQSLGLTNPPGILLAGPPGCGKTLLAKAVANESGINFISVKGPELLNMYVGESERAVRQVFQRARNSVPCVIFFDELDALCPRRSGAGEGGSSVRVVNQLLTEMDGLEERKQVFIMGATNRPDIIDPAILRPGRLDKQLYVGLPVAQDRFDILNTLTKFGKKPKLSEDVDLKEIAFDDKCENFTGADLSALVREASVIALKQFMSTANHSPQNFVSVNKKHFQLALDKVKPSVSLQDLLVYMKMQQTLEVS